MLVSVSKDNWYFKTHERQRNPMQEFSVANHDHELCRTTFAIVLPAKNLIQQHAPIAASKYAPLGFTPKKLNFKRKRHAKKKEEKTLEDRYPFGYRASTSGLYPLK